MIFKSTTPYFDFPIKGVYQSLINDANDKATFIDGITGKKLTFHEIESNSKKFAAGLIDKAEFKHGDVLAIFSPNQIDHPTVMFGTIAAGGKVTFVNHKYKVEEVIHQLEDSKAKYIIVFPSLLSIAIGAADAANIPKSNIFLFGDKEINGVKPYSSLLSEREANPVEYSPEETKSTTAYLCYSSGTTGKSKGVEITHYNIVSNIASQFCYDDNDINTNDILIGVLPLFHIYGIIMLVHLTLLKGASVVIIPNFDFNLSEFCKIIQDYQVSVIHIIPSIAFSLVNSPISKDCLSSLRLCISAAAPLSKELAIKFNEMFDLQIKQYFGSTETSITHLVRADNKSATPESIGKLLPNVECKIISEGKEVGYNQHGELYIRSPSIMKGYLNNKEATNECIDSEGWFYTGDIVKVDKFGNFYIVGRTKELIKYEGQQVPPAELESILTNHPSIYDAAVIGIGAEETEYPAAYVVLKQNVSESEQSIKDFVAKRVAPHKRLRGGVFFTDEIPKSNGKVLRRLLKERAEKEHPYRRKQSRSSKV